MNALRRTVLLAGLLAVASPGRAHVEQPFPLVVLSRACAGDLAGHPAPSAQACQAVVALAAADVSQREARLRELYGLLEPADGLRTAVLDLLLEGSLQAAVAEAAGAPRSPEPPGWDQVADRTEENGPEWAKDLPAPLRAALRQRTSLVSRSWDWRSAGTPGADLGDFHETVAALMQGRADPGASLLALRRFEFVRGCRSAPEAPVQDKAFLLALLRTGPSEALAATLLERAFHGAQTEDWPLLEAAGLDAELLHVAGLLGGDAEAGRCLGRRGGTSTVELLLAAIALPDLRHREDDLLDTLAGLVTPGPACDEGTAAPELPFVSDLAQAQVLEALSARALAPALSTATPAVHHLARLRRPETAVALREVLISPFTTLRPVAAAALRCLGEPAEPEPARKVPFQVLIDGQPARRIAVSIGMTGEGGETAYGLTTDEQGLLALDPDLFVDPTFDLQTVRLARAHGQPGPWFDVELPRPDDLSAVTAVEVRSGSLTLEIAEPGGFWMLFGEDSGLVARSLDHTGSSVLPLRVQRGRYEFIADLPAGGRFERTVEVDEEPVLLSVPGDTGTAPES